MALSGTFHAQVCHWFGVATNRRVKRLILFRATLLFSVYSDTPTTAKASKNRLPTVSSPNARTTSPPSQRPMRQTPPPSSPTDPSPSRRPRPTRPHLPRSAPSPALGVLQRSGPPRPPLTDPRPPLMPRPTVVLCEIVNDDAPGRACRTLLKFKRNHKPLCTILEPHLE